MTYFSSLLVHLTIVAVYDCSSLLCPFSRVDDSQSPILEQRQTRPVNNTLSPRTEKTGTVTTLVITAFYTYLLLTLPLRQHLRSQKKILGGISKFFKIFFTKKLVQSGLHFYGVEKQTKI